MLRPFAVLALLAAPAFAEPVGAIQGRDHHSPRAGTNVEIDGVVTLVEGNGFWMQGTPDGDDATSDGLFVFTDEAVTLAPGDRVRVAGRVFEYRPRQRRSDLTLTEIVEPDVETLGRDAMLPAPVILGPGGRLAPSATIDDDALASFDPDADGLDFYETLEGMRVGLQDAVALAPPDRFGKVWVVAAGGAGATGFDGRALTLTDTDQNPERMRVDLSRVRMALPDAIEAGTPLGDLVGVMAYGFGSYELEATSLGATASAEIAMATPSLSVAVYNVENLDPVIEDVENERAIDDDTEKFLAIATQIAGPLGGPAIVALQEVQDNDGAEQSSITAADLTLATLAAAIEAAGGPAYAFIDLPPEDDADGGQPGGNIRVAYLYDPERARPIAAGARRLVDPTPADGDAFENSRKPVLAAFETAAGPLTLINVHFASRGGSDPAFGAKQPPSIGDAEQRAAQSALVADEAAGLLEADPDALVAVLGDFNAFWFEAPLTDLEETAGLTNLWRTLPERARRSFVFEGQAQALDHIVVSRALAERTALRALDVNAGRLGAPSDHDPLLMTIAVEATVQPDDAPPDPDGRTGLDLPEPPADLDGEALRAWLRANWYQGRHRDLGYAEARRAMYSVIDIADDGRVYGVYSGFSQPGAVTTFLDPINAEHTVPQSWYDRRRPMRSDIHHLFPTHEEVNNARDSDPFGEIDDGATETWYGVGADGRLIERDSAPQDERDRFAEDTRDRFEPPEGQEGNTARAIFYFYTMYPGEGRDLSAIVGGDPTRLGDWHETDAPDAAEQRRNDRIEAAQGNRNPYVDRPELVCRTFPEACG